MTGQSMPDLATFTTEEIIGELKKRHPAGLYAAATRNDKVDLYVWGGVVTKGGLCKLLQEAVRGDVATWVWSDLSDKPAEETDEVEPAE